MFVVALALATAVTATALTAAAPYNDSAGWSGPSLQLVHTPGGFPALALSRGGESPTLLPPHWLNINNQGVPDVPAIVEQLTRAREAGVRLICVVLSDSLTVPPVSAGTRQLMALVRAHHPTAVLLVRWLIESWVPDRVHAGTSSHGQCRVIPTPASPRLSIFHS